jgi:hypothetical protein
MKAKPLLSLGVLASAFTSFIVLSPAAHASTTTSQSTYSADVSCNVGNVYGSVVIGYNCSGAADGVYDNAYIAIQSGGVTDGFSCSMVVVDALGDLAQGIKCTQVS